MQSENKVGIVVITYNQPVLIVPQLDCIRRFCRDSFEVIVIDNSTDNEAAAAIEYHARDCRYLKVNASAQNSSESHAFAANFAWLHLSGDYSHLLFLDHDNFPVVPFSVVEMMDGAVMGGLGQQKSKLYFWAGFVMFDVAKVKDVDFGCNKEHQLDTGGNLYREIERVGVERCKFFGETYFQNHAFDPSKSKYNFYSLIGGKFMHFINGSNWASSENHIERLNSLLNVLNERINEGSSLAYSSYE